MTLVEQVDVGVLLLLGEEVGYQVVLGVVAWEEVHVVGGLEGGQEEGLAEGRGADLAEVQGVEDGALDPSDLQACREASRMEEHLVVGLVVGQKADQVVSSEELAVDPEEEARSLVDQACVGALAVQLAHQEVEGVD